MAKIFIFGNVASSLIGFRGKLIEEMVALGHRVVAGAADPPDSVGEAFARLGVQYHQIPLDRAGTNPLKDVSSVRALVSLFQRERPDMVLSYTVKPVVYGSIGARLAGVPMVCSMITGLGYAFAGTSLKRRLVNRMVRLM
jgi:hypothetical protein